MKILAGCLLAALIPVVAVAAPVSPAVDDGSAFRGEWTGVRGLEWPAQAWVEASTAQHTPAADYPYGYYWRLSIPGKSRLDAESGYMAIGQAGQFIVVMPRLKAVVVVTSSNWQAGGAMLGLSQVIDRYVVPALQGAAAAR